MPTPDFEEWLQRQDIPLEDTLEEDRYIEYLKEQFGITGGTEDVARGIYRERYNIMAELGVRPFEWHTTIQGVRYDETRYALEGLRGAFGYKSALQYAMDKAVEQEWKFAEDWLAKKLLGL